MAVPENLTPKKVWDLPTRLFHWCLAVCVIAGYIIGENMSFANYNWHFWAGYITGGLVVFRVLWGFVGGKASRFASFFPTPKRVLTYMPDMMTRTPSGVSGHSPVGALSVFALLFVLAVQVVTGLLSYSDDYFAGGFLSGYVSESTQQCAGWVHHELGDILFLLIVLHLAAIAFYYIWKRENLIKPMITGWKKVK